MADHTITITVPGAKVATALEGFLAAYPNNEKDEEGKDKYTNAQWVNEVMRRILVRDVRRGLVMKARNEIDIAEDDDLAITK